MNIYQTHAYEISDPRDEFDTHEQHGHETTNLMELVAAVDEHTDSTEETVHVVRHMLLSGRFSFEGQPQRLQLD